MAPESKLFDLKPQLTLAMKLAATFAITYYGMLFLYTVATLVLYHYSIDSYYYGNERILETWSEDFLFLILEFLLSGLLVFSLIQIFRKKSNGKALFVSASILLIAFQLFTTGVHPWVKYALEVLMVLIITPIRMKKRIIIKKGKLTLEEHPDGEGNLEEEESVNGETTEDAETSSTGDSESLIQ